MFIPRKGTRLGLVSRGKALVQLAALPKTNVRGILTMHAVCWWSSVTRGGLVAYNNITDGLAF